MRLENASVNQWEHKCNSDGSSAVELTISADIVKYGSPSTFCNPDVRRDFEDYISKYKYNGGFSRPRKTVVDLKKENDILRTSLDYEIKKKNEFSEQLAIMSAKENNAVLCLKNISLLLGINEDSSAREVFDKVKELSEELEKLREDVDALCDASKKAGSVGNGVYLDGLTVEQNLRTENVRLKAECDGYKKDIKKLKNSLGYIYGDAATALGYEW